MTQQPYGGYPQQGGYPPQQGYQAPQQQYAPQPPQNMEQAWGNVPGQQPQQQAQPPIQQAVDPTAASASFFGGMGGGGERIPSFKWGSVGDLIQGKILEATIIECKDYTSGEVIIDSKTGQPAQQLKIVLETGFRNWEKAAKIPEDENTKQPLPPHEDDGRRAIYTGGKRSDGRSWMSGAIQDAMREAGRDPSQGLEIGAMLGVQVKSEEPSGQGNPYRTYTARYVRPGATPQPAPQPQAAQPQYQAPPQQPQAAPQQAGWGQQATQPPAPQQAPQGATGFDGFQPQQPQPTPQPQQPPANPWGGAEAVQNPPF